MKRLRAGPTLVALRIVGVVMLAISATRVSAQAPSWLARYDSGPGDLDVTLGDLRGQDWPTRHIAVDAAGFVYVVMSNVRSFPADSCVLAKYRPDGTPVWLKASPERGCFATGLSLDSRGGVYIVGSLQIGRPQGVDYDWIVIKFDGNGDRQWVRYWDGIAPSDTSFATAIAANDSGVVVAGTSAPRVNPSSRTLALRRYDSAGALMWESPVGPTADGPIAVTIDASNRVTVMGDTFAARYDAAGVQSWLRVPPPGSWGFPVMAADESGSVWLGGGSLVVRWNADGQEAWRATIGMSDVSDVAVRNGVAVLVGRTSANLGAAIGLDANGAATWSRSWPKEYPYVVALAASGAAVVAGWRANNLEYAFWVATCDTAGSVLWERADDAPGNLDGASAIALGSDGSIHLGGLSQSTTIDATTLKYTANGAPVWVVKEPPIPRSDRPGAMVAHGDGSVTVAVAGWLAAASGPRGGLRRYSGTGNLTWAQMAPEFYRLADDGFGGVVGGAVVTNVDRDVVVERYNASGNRLWSRVLSVASTSDDYLAGLAVDGAGNVFVSWGGGASPYVYEYFLSKYDRDGNLVWKRASPAFSLMAADDSGLLFAVGSASGAVTHSDVLVARLAPDGATLWSRSWDGPTNREDSAAAIALDSAGNLVIAVRTSPWSGTNIDYATLKYDPQGNLLWARTRDGAGAEDQPFDVAVDGADNVTATGWSLRGSTYDAMTVSYDAAGNERWMRSYPTGTGSVGFQKLTAALNGAITVITPVWNGLDSDIAALRYDSSGSLSWVWTLGGEALSADRVGSIVTDASGRATVVGSLWTQDGADDVVLAQFAGDPSPGRFNVLTPCRILDTREPGLGGPTPLEGRVARVVMARGTCGIPESAHALALNVTVTNSTVPGNLRVFPGGFPVPFASTANHAPGQTRANNAIVGLGAGGRLGLLADQAAGTVHVIVDVSGYFE